MARTKRKVKNRARAHVAHVKRLRKRRIFAAGSRRTAQSRSRKRMARLAAKVARN